MTRRICFRPELNRVSCNVLEVFQNMGKKLNCLSCQVFFSAMTRRNWFYLNVHQTRTHRVSCNVLDMFRDTGCGRTVACDRNASTQWIGSFGIISQKQINSDELLCDIKHSEVLRIFEMI